MQNLARKFAKKCHNNFWLITFDLDFELSV